MKRTGNVISVFIRLCISLLVLALVAGAIAFLVTYVRNGQRSFTIKYGNETIIGEKKGVELPKDGFSLFLCNSMLGQSVDYTVEIYLNTANVENFEFTASGDRKNFKNEFADYDCSKLFQVSKLTDSFAVFVPADLTLEKVIRAKYPDGEITGVPVVKLDEKDSFVIKVTDSVERSVTLIYFC